MPMAKADTLGPFVRRLQQSGIERITIDRGVTTEEITTFIDAVTTIDARQHPGGDGPGRFRRCRTSASGGSPSSSASRAA